MVFERLLSAVGNWRRLDGSDRLTGVVRGVRFEDGGKKSKTPPARAITTFRPRLPVATSRGIAGEVSR